MSLMNGGVYTLPFPKTNPYPTVAAGQTWMPSTFWARWCVRVTSVDRALVRTDGIGQTTVFHLLRHYRLVSA